jgi:hypothetical protein
MQITKAALKVQVYRHYYQSNTKRCRHTHQLRVASPSKHAPFKNILCSSRKALISSADVKFNSLLTALHCSMLCSQCASVEERKQQGQWWLPVARAQYTSAVHIQQTASNTTLRNCYERYTLLHYPKACFLCTVQSAEVTQCKVGGDFRTLAQPLEKIVYLWYTCFHLFVQHAAAPFTALPQQLAIFCISHVHPVAEISVTQHGKHNTVSICYS